MSSCAALHSCVTLAERVAAADYAARVNEVVACLAGASEPSDVLLLLHQATRELGAERGVFISFVRDETLLSSCRYLLACEPQWCRDVQEAGGWAHDPWLAYATHHSEAIVASRLEPSDAPPRRLTEIAARHGFASAVLVPAHSGPGHARCGLLCLGSATPGYFEADGFVHFRIGARSVAMELHEWWLARLQRELVVRAHITPSDLVLLEHQRQGHSTKRIANALRLSLNAVNSRFQRLNSKLGVGTRKAAARLAAECGLIDGGGVAHHGSGGAIQPLTVADKADGSNDSISNGGSV